MREVVLIQVSFLQLALKKNNNNKHAEYHDSFIPFKGQIYSKQGSHISLLFCTWTFSIILSCLGEAKFLLLTLTWQTSLTFNFCTNTFLLCLPRIMSRQYLFISSRKRYLSLKLSTVCPQEKSSHKKNHADSEYSTCLLKNVLTCSICHRVDIYRIVKRLASSLW